MTWLIAYLIGACATGVAFLIMARRIPLPNILHKLTQVVAIAAFWPVAVLLLLIVKLAGSRE